MGKILIGTCNWSDHESFYPGGLKPNQRLTYYARFFPIVEVDSTFYRLMPARNFASWAEKTPPDFVFNVKAYRTMTRHGPEFRPGARHADDDPSLDPAEEDFRRFDASIQPLRDAGKLRAIHFQFPPWFRLTERNREYLATCREYFPRDLVAVEFRHRSWLDGDAVEPTLALLRNLGLVYTAVDQPQIGSGSVPPIAAVTNPALAIVRFHGRNHRTWYIKGAASSTDRFDYLYRRDELAEWVPKIEQMAAVAHEVHILMNNNRNNYAVLNARDVASLLDQPIPELELDPAASQAEQPRLPLDG